MANDFLTAQSGPIAQVALQTLYRQIVLPMLVWRDFSAQTAGQGDTVTIRKPATLTARRYSAALRNAGTPIVLDDVTETGIPVTLDTHSYSAVAIPDEDDVLEIANFATQVLAPQTKAVAEDLEDVIAAVLTAATTTSEVQTVTITGTPTSGNFTLTYRGATTANIAYNATVATVLAQLNALSTINEGDVAVGGGPGPGTPYTVTFDPELGNVDQMSAAHTFGGGTTPNVAVTTTTAGVSGSIGEITVPPWDGTAANDPALKLIDGWEYLTENKVPNNGNRILVMGARFAGNLLRSERVSRVDASGTDTALRRAAFQPIYGWQPYESLAIPSDQAYGFTREAVALATATPRNPRGATASEAVNQDGVMMRWLSDYDPSYLRDRSIVSVISGAKLVDSARIVRFKLA
ncbi:MAG: hypothetical protein LC799_25280 [Actinobacteria bacterium]|nr:hypothetical protein [Actinomycetota bacterium]